MNKGLNELEMKKLQGRRHYLPAEYSEKVPFLYDEFFMLSWAAAVQHNKVWNEIESDFEKNKFRQKIRKEINVILKEYEKLVSEEKHIENIKKIQQFSKEFGNELNIGTVQKLLNMMCKYCWCVGWIPEPPHLPIDSINLAKIKKSDVKWTEIATIEEYMSLISEFKKEIQKDSCPEDTLAGWELAHWKRRSSKEEVYPPLAVIA